MNGKLTFTRPLVTNEDRQRGWAELEIQFTDGQREFVRVHALEPTALLRLASLSPVDALRESLAKALRATPEFVARIGPAYQVAIMGMLAFLMHDNAEAAAGVELATAATLKLRRIGKWPGTTAEMRASLANCAAIAQPFKTALQGLIQSSKIPQPPRI